MNIVLFEDQFVETLSPITLSRPAYTITCGAYNWLELAQQLATQLGGTLHGWVRPYLRPLHGDFCPAAEFDPSVPTLLINAQLLPHHATSEDLLRRARQGTPFKIEGDGRLLTALMPAGKLRGDEMDASGFTFGDLRALVDAEELELVEPSTAETPTQSAEYLLLEFPHDVIRQHTLAMSTNLKHRIRNGQYHEIADNVYSADARLVPAHVVLDASKGPIVLEQDVELGAFSVLTGPTYVGQASKISPHSLLKGNVSIGHKCKVGGEVSQSIVESCSNKVHYGFLGCAYIGMWVNLGAGTTNSNLKNTYGTVRMEYDSGKVDTGQQFMGCVIGDFSKTAINTSIFTGKTIGVCSNIYGFVTQNVPSFANYARSLGDVTEHPPEVMEVTQKRCFRRRGMEQRDCDRQLIRDMYAIESPKRELANTPPSL